MEKNGNYYLGFTAQALHGLLWENAFAQALLKEGEDSVIKLLNITCLMSLTDKF